MSLQPEPLSEIPAETARIARAAFRKGNVIMRLRDEFGALYADADLAHLFPKRGQPAWSPWRLALITVFQFLEQLSDRDAADAVRARLDCLGQNSADDDACPLEVRVRSGARRFRL